MPCKIFLRQDDAPVYCNEAADVVLQRVESADGGAFISIAMTPVAHDDEPRTGYLLASEVVAILAMHPRERAADLEDPPEWYTG